MQSENPTPRLSLPKRWEFLQEQANAVELDPAEVVERVDDAAERVDTLLRKVRTGGGGLIEVVYGLSGSGKTTFLKTLTRFFEGVNVSTFPSDLPIEDLPAFIKNGYIQNSKLQRIVLIERRDNPKQSELNAIEEVFAILLEVFREKNGAVVILWPITNADSAEKISATAWKVGRDSMADSTSKGQFTFKGIPRERYFEIADNTCRTLTGDSLEAFGVTADKAEQLIPQCETISDFFGAVNDAADHVRDETWSILRAKIRTHLWVVLPGDDVKALNATASALTQGTRSRIDIDLIGEFIDRPDNNTIYVNYWRERRSSLAQLMRTVDLRLFSFPPNVSLAAIRSFGTQEIKSKLKQPATNLESSKSAMRSSRLYKAILAEAGISTTPFAGSRDISKETVDEFLRIQALASANDKPLNKALGSLIEACLKEDAPELKVTSEKKSLPNSSLQPDIQIQIRPDEFICLEPTWRTSGKGIEGEIKSAQNTLAEAHLKKYLLDKAAQYLSDLGL